VPTYDLSHIRALKFSGSTSLASKFGISASDIAAYMEHFLELVDFTQILHIMGDNNIIFNLISTPRKEVLQLLNTSSLSFPNRKFSLRTSFLQLV